MTSLDQFAVMLKDHSSVSAWKGILKMDKMINVEVYINIYIDINIIGYELFLNSGARFQH